MAVAKASAETEPALKEDSAEERDTDGGSGETKEVDLTRTEAVLKEKSADEIDLIFQLILTNWVLLPLKTP